MDVYTVVIIRRCVAAATYMARLEGRAVTQWSAAERRVHG